MMKDVYMVAGWRSAVCKAKRGAFRHFRSDDLAVELIQGMLKRLPQLEPERVDDLIVGNAVPEAEQGLQIGRMISVRALGVPVSGMTVNRYCASGLEAIAIAHAKIQAGMAECIIAGGTESMSLVPISGWKTAPNYQVAQEHPDYYLGMGLTAEAVARAYQISREDQDLFSFQSHQKALQAIQSGELQESILPIEVEQVVLDDAGRRQNRKVLVRVDEGPRPDTSLEALARLKPVFAAHGTVTAGNSSQTSDGAAFVVLMSDDLCHKLGLQPEGRLLSCASAGVQPGLMGIGPVEAVPKALKQAGKTLADIDLIELNEAFASQSLAVIRHLGMDPSRVNIHGGAIALGHPLGCTGCKLTVQMLHHLKRQQKPYGLVTACVGGGQGIAAVVERFLP